MKIRTSLVRSAFGRLNVNPAAEQALLPKEKRRQAAALQKLRAHSAGAWTFALLFVAVALVVTTARSSQSQSRTHTAGFVALDQLAQTSQPPQEAPTGFDNLSNGLVDEQAHGADLHTFEETETIEDGLGPVFNAQACRECHQSPVTGAISQVTELRVGRTNRFGQFENPVVSIGDGTTIIANRSLINDRAICPSGEFPDSEIQERVPDNANVHTFRASLNTLGDGFVEAISSLTLLQFAAKQCKEFGDGVCGQPVFVPVLEAPGQMRVGRFGWKNQHASLLSFSADAYLNEMGITSRLQPEDVTKLCDTVADPENTADAEGLADIDRFARFMRASKAPARDASLAATFDARLGADIFGKIGCDTCHVPTIVTAPSGSVINGGSFVVPDALGNKIIHPFSHFLLHNVGTGDGIVQNGGPLTALKLRTPPLWGVRLRSRLMHDQRALTFHEAIVRHGGEATLAVRNFRNLTDQERQQLITFLKSL